MLCPSIAFISFDVVEFYRSITEDLLRRALDFASSYVNISPDDRQIIIRAKHSLLFNNETPWQKKNSSTLFDVTMGSYDGAETCELVGCYLLSQLTKIPEIDIGLYRDDGLAVINQTPQKIEKIKKEICKIFAQNNLRITIESNKKIVNFLDVTLDLTTGRFKPFSKPATTPLYVHSKSNHPPSIIRNIPEAINKRLSEISCDEDAFNEAAPQYQEALRKSGYAYTLKFKPEQQRPPNQKKKNAQNPEENQPQKMCNCRNEKECPLEGECLQNEIVYQATVTTRGVTGTTETYVGLTATDFKTRWRNHQMSFKHEKRRNDTELSKHLWKLKEKKEGYSIS